MTDTSSWLIATKLHPPLVRGEIIRRPHLEATLTQSVRTLPVTLISAPAGYGKTTLLAALPGLLPDYPLAWATLDAEENDPTRFLGLLAAACQRLHPDCGRSVWPWLSGGSMEGASLKRAAGALVNDILACLPNPFILVLDDLHFVTEPAVYVALEHLLDHQPPQLHIALGTRHDPPLRLARLAARRLLGELRRPELGFSLDETRMLLNGTLGLDLAPAEVAALQDRTEGWPAGLCLLAAPLGRVTAATDRSQFMATVAMSERSAFEFLAEEVLRTMEPGLRRFLLQTSVLAEMTPSLCQAVTGRADAADLLEDLYRQNLTIAAVASTATGEPVYRHHALFARLLSRQLMRELPDEVALLHSRAAQAERTPGRAIAHCMAAGLWQQAAQIMMRTGATLLHQGLTETLHTWYNALPADVQQHPRLVLLMGACALHRGDFAAAGSLFARARTAFAASGDAEGEGEALSASITIALQCGNRAETADLVAQSRDLPLSPMGRARVLLTRAWLHLWAGEWGNISDHVGEALAIPRVTGNRQADLVNLTFMSAPLAAAPGCLHLVEGYAADAATVAPPGTAWRLGAEELGVWPALWRGHTDQALCAAEAAEALRLRLGGFPFLGNDLPVQLCMLYLARSDMAAAGRAVDTLLQRLQSAPRIKLPFFCHAAGRGLALLGRLGEAHALCHRLAAGDGTPLTAYLHDHLTGLIALVEGRTADAAAVIQRAAAAEPLLPVARVGGSGRLLQAQWHFCQGRHDAAISTLGPVLAEWEAAGTPGCILLDGPAILPALRLAAQRGNANAARASALFQSAPAADASVPAPLPEPLTERECDVLRLVVAGRSNPQIGKELYITTETVKTHVAHILRKLDVTSRTQAAIRGRELGF